MDKMNKDDKAILRSAQAPSQESWDRLLRFLRQRYGGAVELVWFEDPSLQDGFLLTVGTDVYDWSLEGRLRQFKNRMDQVRPARGGVIPLIKEAVENWVPQATPEEVGTVVAVGDEIATVTGLKNASYGEILLFPSGVKGMVQELRRDEIGCMLFGDGDEIVEGSIVHRSGKTAGIPVGDDFLGRVINALGEPIDGKGEITSTEYRPIEAAAPAIIDRQPVNTPMETGLLAIDTMFPIGRGQRELIIGDRQTGKTAIAVDTILNQKDQDVICIYVAIGQKASTVAKLRGTLEKYGALSYSIIVSATAADSAPQQYIAPYAGAAMGEYFMDQGKDVLIIYDDLSKHAVAYRALSLLLRRSPGREAYPGDVFYLHSRLLERACRLTEEYGGGSMTALPIIETLAGDVSAYIPTNVISITDGQIYLEKDLFFSGQRPAVNVGLSVSRVGGSAQTKAVKKSAGTLRIDLARFRELEVFTQFSSDLDKETRQALDHGKRLMEILKQPLYNPMPVWKQAVILYVATSGLLSDVDLEKINPFVQGFCESLEAGHADLIQEIQSTGTLPGAAAEQLRTALEEYKKQVNG